ncbi:hypothetical protein B0H17DRAFT_1209680 [Mycena rosella]|uniref:Uncharacterized protein n=1 Tax=Mycena rosella TaxID=1033263 RepID=A0AAD7CXW7_MYCRO|nr:hypothetical protein B0H17DRAFT_1209680 [Mycena rosella]
MPTVTLCRSGAKAYLVDIFVKRTRAAKGDLVVGVGFGAQFALYISCVRYLWRRKKENCYALFLLTYITVLFSVEFLFIAVEAQTVQMIYIDHRDYPGGPWAFFLATQDAAVNVIFYATLFVLTFLSDMLVLWRCWVIWAAEGRESIAYLAITFPSIVLLGSFGQPIHLESVNIIISILIITRLLMYRRRLLANVPGAYAAHYISVVTIVVESSALYSVFAVLFLITYAIGQPSSQIWLGVASATQQIAGYLIIYRLADGTAWKADTMRLSSIVVSGMRFNNLGLDESVMTEAPSRHTIDLGGAQMKGQKGAVGR